MKRFWNNCGGRLPTVLVASLMILSTSKSHAAVGFTVNPPQITNDFVGKISLTITGLTAEQTVRVERYADLNGNGVIDSGEPLILSFAATDGRVSKIGGVRNLNVPGDEDGVTNGQIRVELPLSGVDRVALAASIKSIFRISDPSAGFAPITQPFAVVQRVRLEAVTGLL